VEPSLGNTLEALFFCLSFATERITGEEAEENSRTSF
jgi:hypothetical protein